MKPSERILQFFTRLPTDEDQKRRIADMQLFFENFTYGLTARMPENAEGTTALRKLLEAKDCAVRALLVKDDVLENLRVHDVAEGPVTPSNLTS